jgi:hypothetical protein
MQWKSFVERYTCDGKTVGGNAYDVTKMSKKVRIEHSWDKIDPLEQAIIESESGDD